MVLRDLSFNVLEPKLILPNSSFEEIKNNLHGCD
jgi:hypothetical protein